MPQQNFRIRDEAKTTINKAHWGEETLKWLIEKAEIDGWHRKEYRTDTFN